MKLENDFIVPVAPSTAWQVLMDIEQVALCMPGATLLNVDGDQFTGKVKIKVGPITVSYKGSAEFVERDEAGLSATIRAKAREERGAGTASALITARLMESGDSSTRVHVVTDLDITGKPAQFGRGVMQEVGGRIIGQFAERLGQQIRDGRDVPCDPGNGSKSDIPPQTDAPSEAPSLPPLGQGNQHERAATREVTVDRSSGGRPMHASSSDDVLDLGLAAWWPLIRRAAPVCGAVALMALLTVLLRRSRSQAPATVILAHYGGGESPHN